MNFHEADAQYQRLLAAVQARQMSNEQFYQAVQQLQVVDNTGVYWQKAADGLWLRWDGSNWQPVPTNNQVQPAKIAATTGKKKSEWLWSVLAVIGGAVGGGLWYFYSSLDKALNQPDWQTAVLMVALPLLLGIFRRPLDRILMIFNPVRRKLPRLLLIGLGLIAPYIVSSYLYNSAHIREYDLIRYSVVFGPLLSYLFIRTPVSR